MKEIIYRLTGTAIIISLGMHGIEYGIEANGGASRRNPVWGLLQGYFDFERMVLLLLAAIGGIIFVLYCLAHIEWKRPISPEEERAQEEQVRRERHQRVFDEQLKARPLDHEEREILERRTVLPGARVHLSSEPSPRAEEAYATSRPIEVSKPRKPTAKELKMKAIHQLFRE